jgi:outer membrane protein assembly factor BamB
MANLVGLLLTLGLMLPCTKGSCLPNSLACKQCIPNGGVEIVSPVAFAHATVYFGSNNNSLFAVRASSGEVTWQFDGASTFSMYSSPVVSPDGQTAFIGSSDKHVYAINAASGQLRWAFETGGFENDVLLSADQHLVLAASNDYSPLSTHLYALDQSSGVKRWAFAINTTYMFIQMLSARVVLLGSNDGHLYALNISDGGLVWASQLSGSPDSKAVQHKSLLILKTLQRAGTQVVAVRSEDGVQAWKSQFYEPAGLGFKPPLVLTSSNGLLFGTGMSTTSLICVSASNGTELWRVKTQGAVLSNPVLGKKIAYFGPTGDPNFYAVDTTTGREQWRASGLPGGNCTQGNTSFGAEATLVDSSTVMMPGYLGGCFPGNLYAFDTSSGRGKWRDGMSWDGYRVQLYSEMQGVAFVSIWKGSLVAVDIASGKQIWEGPATQCL